MEPNLFKVSEMIRSQSLYTLTSATTGTTRDENLLSSLSALSSFSLLRLAITTLAPSAAKRIAQALPIPEEPPVIMTVLLSNVSAHLGSQI